MQHCSEEELLRELEDVKGRMEDIRIGMAPLQKELSRMYSGVLRQNRVDYSRKELPDSILELSRRLDAFTTDYLLLDRRRIEILRELELRADSIKPKA